MEQSFPHGFITTRLFPASFCQLGISRFRRQLNSLPSQARNAVVASLRDRVAEHGIEYVVPADFRSLVSAQQSAATDALPRAVER